MRQSDYNLIMGWRNWAAQLSHRVSSRPLSMNDLLIAYEDGGSIVLHVPSGTYLRLDAAATEILTLLKCDGVSGAALALVERHGLHPDQAVEYVTSVLDQIREARAVGEKSMRLPGLRGGASVIHEWAKLSKRSKIVAVEAMLLIVVIECALRLLPIDTVARRVGAPLKDGPSVGGLELTEIDSSELSESTRRRMAAANWALDRWIFDATCLRKALLHGWILRDHRPELHLGLVRSGDALAHAWLVLLGGTLGALGNVDDFGRLSR